MAEGPYERPVVAARPYVRREGLRRQLQRHRRARLSIPMNQNDTGVAQARRLVSGRLVGLASRRVMVIESRAGERLPAIGGSLVTPLSRRNSGDPSPLTSTGEFSGCGRACAAA